VLTCCPNHVKSPFQSPVLSGQTAGTNIYKYQMCWDDVICLWGQLTWRREIKTTTSTLIWCRLLLLSHYVFFVFF
jgi:hypothetical protein